MTSTTKAVKQKPVKLSDGRHRCLLDSCKKPFTPSRSDQCYCKNDKRDCKSLVRKVKRAKTRAKKPYIIPLDAHQRYRILDAVRAAGSVQILTTWRGYVDEAVATINVLTATNTANLKSGKNTFHTCHLDAANNSFRVGLLSSENLFVGLGSRNRAAGAFISGAGVSISRLELKAKWSVDENMSNADVWALVEEFVGLETLTEACRKAGLKPSAKAQALANLEQAIDPANPDHDKFKAILKDPKSTTIELQMAVAEIQDKRFFNFKLKATTEQEILFSEVLRHSAFRPDLEWLLAPINKMYTIFTDEDGRDHKNLVGVLSDDNLQTLFNLLQGTDCTEDEIDELVFGFNFASRKMTDDQKRRAEQEEKDEKKRAYFAMPWTDRQVFNADHADEYELMFGRKPVLLNWGPATADEMDEDPPF